MRNIKYASALIISLLLTLINHAQTDTTEMADTMRSNGRIYRVTASGKTEISKPFDLGKLPSTKLIALLSNKNDWWVSCLLGTSRRLKKKSQARL